MSDKVEVGEIVLANLVLIDDSGIRPKRYRVEDVVYKKATDGRFRRGHVLKRLKIKKPPKVQAVEVIKRLGFERKQ